MRPCSFLGGFVVAGADRRQFQKRRSFDGRNMRPGAETPRISSYNADSEGSFSFPFRQIPINLLCSVNLGRSSDPLGRSS